MLWIKGHRFASAPTLPIDCGPSMFPSPARAICISFCRTSIEFACADAPPVQGVVVSEKVLTLTSRFLVGAELPAFSVRTQFNPKSKSFVPLPNVASGSKISLPVIDQNTCELLTMCSR